MREYLALTDLTKKNKTPPRTKMNTAITRAKKLNAIYNSSALRSIPQYPKIVKIKNKTENRKKKKFSLNDNIKFN